MLCVDLYDSGNGGKDQSGKAHWSKARQMMHTYHEILDFCCEQDMVLPRLQCYPIQMNKDLLHVVYRPQKNWMKKKERCYISTRVTSRIEKALSPNESDLHASMAQVKIIYPDGIVVRVDCCSFVWFWRETCGP